MSEKRSADGEDTSRPPKRLRGDADPGPELAGLGSGVQVGNFDAVFDEEDWGDAGGEGPRLESGSDRETGGGEGAAFPPPREKVAIPPAMRSALKEHQVKGIEFMWSCVASPVGRGCILAHSMGLGKTAQALGLSYAFLSQEVGKTVLVLAPKSTISNWIAEMALWRVKGGLSFPGFRGYRIDTCPTGKRRAVIEEWNRKGGVLYTSYEQYGSLTQAYEGRRKEVSTDEKRALLRGLRDPGPDLLICDEGHILRSSSSAIFATVRKINTRRRVILTGTPLQNHLMEYWCMIEFVWPGKYHRAFFRDYFEKPIVKGQRWDSSADEYQTMKQRSFILSKEVSSFVQRLDQSLLRAALPEKREFVVFCPLSPFQQTIYDTFRSAFLAHRWKGNRSLLAFIVAINKIGGHPDLLRDFLLRQKAKDDPQATEWMERLGMLFEDEYRTGRVSQSPKLMALMYLFEHVIEFSEKLLVFSQFVETLNLIERTMRRLVPNLCCWRLDGSMTGERRAKGIADFQAHTGSAVFLISTRAGGVGINLNTAHRAVLFDVSFNPANDQQAIFRCYRYGLEHPVFIHRFVSQGTPEATLYNRCLSKEWVAKKVVDETTPTRDYVTVTDLRSVFNEEEEHDTIDAIRWHRETQLCLSKDEVLKKVVAKLAARGYKVERVHRHESLLIDDASATLTEKDKKKAVRDFQEERPQAAPESQGSNSDASQGSNSEASQEDDYERDLRLAIEQSLQTAAGRGSSPDPTPEYDYEEGLRLAIELSLSDGQQKALGEEEVGGSSEESPFDFERSPTFLSDAPDDSLLMAFAAEEEEQGEDEAVNECPICWKAFSGTDQLQQHVELQHSDVLQ